MSNDLKLVSNIYQESPFSTISIITPVIIDPSFDQNNLILKNLNILNEKVDSVLLNQANIIKEINSIKEKLQEFE